MSSSSRKRKNKWKTVAFEEILPNAVVRPTTSWAEEVESELNEYTIKKISSINLPTAPRATCDLVIDESKIPANGPFMAYLSNLPYEITEDDITQQFKELKIVNIQLPKDSRHDRMKGFGYVEFKDKSNLLSALNEGELMLKGRLVRISLPNEDEQNKDKGSRSGNVSFSRRDMSDRIDNSDRNLGEWRAAAPIPHDPEKGGFTRPGQREGPSGSFREPRAFDPEPSSFSRGGFRERDRDRDFEGRSNDRGGNRLFGKRYDRDDRDRDRDRGSRMGFGKRFDREDREFRREPLPEKEEPKSRPKLEIQPRTKPLEPNVPEALPSSIFGGAKPVDTLKREMEIEAKLSSMVVSQPARSRTSTPPPRSSTPGSNRSRSSSVSSLSSNRRPDIDNTEQVSESHQIDQSDDESRGLSRKAESKTEFKEPAPLDNYWQRRANKAAVAENTISDSSSVIEKSSVENNSININVENRSQNADASKPSNIGEERRSTERSSDFRRSNEANPRSAMDKDCNSDDGFIRYEPDYLSNPDTSQQSNRPGRYNDSKFNFNRDNRRDGRRDNRARRPDNAPFKKDDNHYGSRSENSYGQRWTAPRNRNGGPSGRKYSDRDNGYSHRDKHDSGSNFSNRSSCSSSTTNLRDDGDTRNDRYERRSDERLIDDINASEAHASDDRSSKEAADERLKIVNDDNANKKTIENGNENGVDSEDVAKKSNESIAMMSEQSELNDNSFSSSKSRKRDKKKKSQEKKDNDQVNEKEHEKRNQKDDKKKTIDNHQTNDKTNHKNNAKNKDKSSKKNRDVRREFDDISQMPKAKEEKAPNFQDSNRFLFLEDDE